MVINSIAELQSEINKAISGNKEANIYQIAKFKWNNYYTDLGEIITGEEISKMSKIFSDLEKYYPWLDEDIESCIDRNWIDDGEGKLHGSN
jgi:hypothetical protein